MHTREPSSQRVRRGFPGFFNVYLNMKPPLKESLFNLSNVHRLGSINAPHPAADIDHLVIQYQGVAAGSIFQEVDDAVVCEDHHLMKCRESKAEGARTSISTFPSRKRILSDNINCLYHEVYPNGIQDLSCRLILKICWHPVSLTNTFCNYC